MLDHLEERDRQLIVERLRTAGSQRTYPARSFIFHEGDASPNVFVIDSGLVRIEHAARNGRILLFDLALAGRVVGELGVIGRVPRSATVSTITETSIYFVEADEFRRMLATDNELQGAMLGSVARRLREMSMQLAETSTMDAPGRVAGRLVRLVQVEQSFGRSTADADGVIDLELPISQEELGQWAGLSREGTVKGLTALRTMGLLETGRKRVRILDLEQLTKVAGVS